MRVCVSELHPRCRHVFAGVGAVVRRGEQRIRVKMQIGAARTHRSTDALPSSAFFVFSREELPNQPPTSGRRSTLPNLLAKKKKTGDVEPDTTASNYNSVTR